MKTRVPKLLKKQYTFENGSKVNNLLSLDYKSVKSSSRVRTKSKSKKKPSFNDQFDLLKKEQLLDHDFMSLMKKKDNLNNHYKRRFAY